MKTIVLSVDESSEAVAVRMELDKIRSLGGAHVFRTTVHSPEEQGPGMPMPEHFITTSKRIHLRLGQMSIGAQWELAMLVRRQLSDHTSGALMVFEDETRNRSFLATIVLSKGDNDLHIHLAPAH